MANTSKHAVKIEDIRWRCEPDQLGFETTDDIDYRPYIIGQDRALDAIRLGLEMRSPGYNIFVSGLTGTGKSTAIERILKSIDRTKRDLSDIIYLYNFDFRDTPVCVTVPAGQGGEFKAKVFQVFETIRDYIPLAFRSDKYKEKHNALLEDVKTRKAKVIQKFEKEVNDKGFSMVQVEYGQFSRPEIAPIIAGEIVPMEKLPGLVEQGKLGAGDYEKIHASYPGLMVKLDEVLVISRDLDRELGERMAELERNHVQPMIDRTLEEINGQYTNEKITRYIKGLRDYIVDNLNLFFTNNPEKAERPRREDYIPFDVNLLVDNAKVSKAPVVIETAPTYVNLFGTIERHVDDEGEYITDFTKIRAGSLARAMGGYLVLNLNDILEEPHVWPTLKRVLKHKKLVIRGFDSLLLMPIASLKPEPIDLDLKVVLLGDAYSYHVLYEYDEDFGKIFKVKSEFDSVMPKQKKNISRYCQFIRNMCKDENLLAFHKTGAAAVIEEGVRIAGRKDKISTRFSDISDLIRESSYWAQKAKSKIVYARHVEKARSERARRVCLYEDKVREMINNGTILMDIDGAKIGQVNGLAVYDIGDYAFGRPNRITVETGVGRAGVINVERESDMSGRTYNKGMLILDGYIRKMYAQDKPVTMNASICFEQSYSGIDGDSASSTEVYALLSSLAEVPLRQDIAVTGSVNQKGEVQPIGGVNEKIEGFYAVCKHKGLTGKQGVMIPKLNQAGLMLRKDIAEDIEKGKFHIYSVSTIDQGIEVLTGVKAGRKRRNGKFDKNTVHYLVDRRLRQFHDQLKEAEETGDEKYSYKV